MTDTASSNWPAGMQIANAKHAQNIHEQGMIKPARTSGYIHLAAEIERPHPLRKPSKNKREIIKQVKQFASELLTQPGVLRADVFNAFIIPPNAEKECRQAIKEKGYEFHIAKFDLAVLVECKDVETASKVRESDVFKELHALLNEKAAYTHCITAINPICIDDVDKSRNGIFLFNHFYSDGVSKNEDGAMDVVIGTWEYTAGWWTKKANLTNSTPFAPIEGETSEYAIINHCRWNRLIDVLPSLIFRPTLMSFVIANFTANRMVAMPILYKLA